MRALQWLASAMWMGSIWVYSDYEPRDIMQARALLLKLPAASNLARAQRSALRALTGPRPHARSSSLHPLGS